MAGDFAADIAERASEVQATAGVELADVLAVEMLPRSCRLGGLVGAKARSVCPLIWVDQGIDATCLEVDSDQITALQFCQTATGNGLWGCVQDRGASGGSALTSVAQGGQFADSLLDPAVRGEHVDHLAGAWEAQGTAASDDQQRIWIASLVELVDSSVVIFRSVEDDRFDHEGVFLAGLGQVLFPKGIADHTGFDQSRIEEVTSQDHEPSIVLEGIIDRANNRSIGRLGFLDILLDCFAGAGRERAIEDPTSQQFLHHRGQATRSVKVFGQ